MTAGIRDDASLDLEREAGKDMTLLDQPDELRAHYRERSVVDRYLERRTAQPLNGWLHRCQVRFLDDALRAAAPRRVLEIAPGPARLTAELEFAGPLFAVDASPEMLALARARLRERGSACCVLRGDAFHLPFPDAAFDFVYTLKFIRHFQPEDRRRLYAEIRRVLSPNGAFVMDAQSRRVSLPHRLKKGLHTYRVHDVLYDSEEELRVELEQARFRVVRSLGILRQHSLQRRFNRLRRIGLGGLGGVLIRAAEHLPNPNPSTWMLLSEVA